MTPREFLWLIYILGFFILTISMSDLSLDAEIEIKHRWFTGGTYRPLGPTGVALVLSGIVLLWPVSLPTLALYVKWNKTS